MTVEQLVRATCSVFSLHHERLAGLPFFTSFSLNCCQGASIAFGMQIELLPTPHIVTVVQNVSKERRESHYWLESDGLLYDLTLNQFQETLINKYDGIAPPLCGAAKHSLQMYFRGKEWQSRDGRYRITFSTLGKKAILSIIYLSKITTTSNMLQSISV
ncbi:hypothetical protein [Aeromonas veronii]